jgi:hypothetical protein
MVRAILIAAALLALAAPAAHADSFDKVFHDYSKDGRIDPCKHSTAELQRARRGVPPDIEQYAPDFPNALDQAIEARARGKCDKKPAAAAPQGPTGPTGPAASTTPPVSKTGTQTTAAATTPGEPPAPTANAAPAGAPTDEAIARAASTGAAGGGTAVPAPLIGLSILAGLLSLAGLAYGIARWRAWEPPWALRARHAAGEAGWRASATWAEFTDWLRLGR